MELMLCALLPPYPANYPPTPSKFKYAVDYSRESDVADMRMSGVAVSGECSHMSSMPPRLATWSLGVVTEEGAPVAVLAGSTEPISP